MSPGAFTKAGLGKLHDHLAACVARGDVPGLVALVSRRGDAFVEAMGSKSIESVDPVRRDTVFRISSMTKPVTAAATMILVEDGKLGLDDPIERHIGELAGRRVLRGLESPLEDTVPASRSITVKDLLTFTLGIGIVFAPPGTYPIQKAMEDLRLGQGPPNPSVPPPPDDWIRRLGTLPLIHQPGERWMYNTGSDVLGVLIARVTGKPFEAFLRERLFKPLGMKDTGFSVPAQEVGRLATGYWTNFQTGQPELFDLPAGGQWSRPPAFPSGGGGLVSTADDYLAFAEMLLNGGTRGSATVLSEASVRSMTSDHLTPEQKARSTIVPGFFENHGWGLGVSVLTKADAVSGTVGNYGWDGGLGTSWHNDPKEELITILMTQRAWTSPAPPAYLQEFWGLAHQSVSL